MKTRTRRDVIKKDLVHRAGHVYIDFFHVFPEYARLAYRMDEVLNDISAQLSSQCEKVSNKCAMCPNLQCCDIVDSNKVYANPAINPYLGLYPMLDMDIILKGCGLPKVTIQDVFRGLYPFAYIIHVFKFRRENYANRHDGTHIIMPNYFTTFCFNPVFYFDNLQNIQNQLDSNIFMEPELRTWHKWIFYYLYVKHILGYLDSYNIFELDETSIKNDCCKRCEYNTTFICKVCKLNFGFKEFSQNVLVPAYFIWNNDASDLTTEAQFVTMMDDKALTWEDNAMNVHVEQISRYGLYLDAKKKESSYEHSFYIPKTKKLASFSEKYDTKKYYRGMV